MQIDVLTLFPEMFRGPLDASIVARAKKKKLVSIKVHNLRKWARDKRKSADDYPYGGGEGMILKVEPVYYAVEDLKKRFAQKKHEKKNPTEHVILMTPQGRSFNYRIADKLSALDHLIFICGHYEGEDNRIFEHIAEERLSIGDYILSGGELPAMVVIDAAVRLIPGVLGKEASKEAESFSFTRQGLLKYPQYTRPEEFNDWTVPQVLLSGNHGEIENWRKKQAFKRTKEYRPDLLK